jgi:prolyl-tRNA synthetase
VLDRTYVATLIRADVLAPRSYGRGVPVWLPAGRALAQRLVETYLLEVGGTRPLRVVEHPPLVDRGAHDAVFGRYANVLFRSGPEPRQLRADNLLSSIAHMRTTGCWDPVVSVGALIREERGVTAPLFRDRHIWPAVQLDEVVSPRDLEERMRHHAHSLERLLRRLGLPALTVATRGAGSYGGRVELTVSSTAAGRPTVLSTLYALPPRFSERLGAAGRIIDVGFTGKLIAVAAMHHADDRGILLPSALATAQVAVRTEPADPTPARWLEELDRVGVRVRHDVVGGRARRRWEGRRAAEGVPLFVAPGAAGTTITRRLGMRRSSGRGLPPPMEIFGVLREHDAGLAEAASRRFERALAGSLTVAALCTACRRQTANVLGRISPTRRGRCGCGASATEHLMGTTARVY